MSVAEVGVRLRNTVLSLVIFLSLVLNLVFESTTLLNAISRYALLVYLLALAALMLLLEQVLIRDEDARDALAANVYPARVRTPMRVSFGAYVGVWLLWWFVTQLFFDAGDVSEHGVVAQLVLIPFVLATLSIDVLFDLPARVRHYLVTGLLLVSLVTLFFPTRAWAPQHSGATLRVVLYFFSIGLHDYFTPPNVYANLASEPPPPQQSWSPSDVESGVPTEARRSRIALIFDAYERIDAETLRVREFIAHSAWVLITPLYVALLVYPIVVAAAVYAGRRQRHATDTSETIKPHPTPAAPTPAPPATITPPPPVDDGLPNKVVLRGRRPAPPPTPAVLAPRAPPVPAAPVPAADAPPPTVVVVRTIY